MLYVMICEDKPDSEALRLANRADHLEWVSGKTAMIRLAGPMLSDDGDHMRGSLFIIEAESADAVRQFNGEDPYTRAGLWGKVTIRPFRQVLPADS